jgi:hypothetical protein
MLGRSGPPIIVAAAVITLTALVVIATAVLLLTVTVPIAIAVAVPITAAITVPITAAVTVTVTVPITAAVTVTVTAAIIATGVLRMTAGLAGIAVLGAAIVAALLLAALLLALHLALRLAQHSRVMLGVLEKVLLRHTVVGQLRVPRKSEVFVDDLLRRAAHFAFGAGTVKDTVDDVAERALPVRLRPRAVFG